MPVEFRADLHIHTCLSPCAGLSMTPRAIVERAASLGINILAICDHNSAENAEVTKHLAKKKGINVVPGMEITSMEEVHILGLFGAVEDAEAMQTVVYENLQAGENDDERFGMQVVANEADEVVAFNRRLLIGATGLPVDRVVDLIHSFSGLAIASHIDREGFGIIGQLGFVPAGIEFDGLEISPRITMSDAAKTFSDYLHIPWVTSSDAHEIEDIGRRTTGLLMYHSTFDEIRLAMKGTGGRGIVP
ncbi:MAG: PHP domain-containing protein [Candidatus Sulfobium sp.]|jgi:PHP family Zn ribbon phosphoesterase